jgi:hypothetical protein
VVGYYEYGNESSGSIKCSEFLERLSKCWLLKKDTASWRYLDALHPVVCSVYVGISDRQHNNE